MIPEFEEAINIYYYVDTKKTPGSDNIFPEFCNLRNP